MSPSFVDVPKPIRLSGPGTARIRLNIRQELDDFLNYLRWNFTARHDRSSRGWYRSFFSGGGGPSAADVQSCPGGYASKKSLHPRGLVRVRETWSHLPFVPRAARPVNGRIYPANSRSFGRSLPPSSCSERSAGSQVSGISGLVVPSSGALPNSHCRTCSATSRSRLSSIRSR